SGDCAPARVPQLVRNRSPRQTTIGREYPLIEGDNLHGVAHVNAFRPIVEKLKDVGRALGEVLTGEVFEAPFANFPIFADWTPVMVDETVLGRRRDAVVRMGFDVLEVRNERVDLEPFVVGSQ